MARTLTDDDIAAIADAVFHRFQANPVAAPVERVSVTFQEVKLMLGAPSDKAAQRRIRRLGLKPYALGQYRRKDVENAIARASHNAAKRAAAC